ncbi:MAG TPA: PEP-CTERM sorting domain-containing protein [Gemmataceae bacterium]|jgi:hypothetical protein
MRYTLLALAVALAAGPTEARADMVYYSMTGRIANLEYNTTGSPIGRGDLISWNLQYDRSTPVSTSVPLGSYYQLTGAAITNLVDRTTGYHFFPTPTPSDGAGALALHFSGYDGPLSYNGPSSLEAWSGYAAGHPLSTYSSQLLLFPKSSLPTLDLASLQLNKIPFSLGFTFGNTPMSEFDFEQFGYTTGAIDVLFGATVFSISGPVAPLPEPGSFTLFLLGIVGLAARGRRRRLGPVG